MKPLRGNKTSSFYCYIILAFFACNQLIGAHEHDHENHFSYDEEDPRGPANWGKIRSDWRMCSGGTRQSPIDLVSKRVKIVSNLGRLHRKYKSSNATLTNRGHSVKLSWAEEVGDIHINGTSYQLKECHWHSPSEHFINGKRYNLEAHMVHQTPNGKIAVVGIIYKIGRPDTLFSMMDKGLRDVAHTKDIEKVVGIINPRQIKFGSRKYYRYIGSLTTPPCTQDVIWTIIKKVRTISKRQLRMIRKAVHNSANARPIQPLNKRPVKMYRPNVD